MEERESKSFAAGRSLKSSLRDARSSERRDLRAHASSSSRIRPTSYPSFLTTITTSTRSLS